MKLRIFQYTDPKPCDDDMRWIAARTEAKADAVAKARGWVKLEHDGDGEIYKHVPMPCKTAREYKRAGCDVVLV